MESEKEQTLIEYISYLYQTNRSYEVIGRHIRAVKEFLDSDNPISVKGYKDYVKTNSLNLIRCPLAKEALCQFLRYKGVGHRKSPSKKVIKPLEKLSVISEKNLKLVNDFIYYLTQEEDYSPHTLDVYSVSLKKYFEYANEISVDNYKRFVQMMENEGYAPQTIRLRITALERFSKWMKKPIELKRPKFQRRLNTENVPTEAEYQRLLEYLKTRPNQDQYFFIKILATTGARISEFIQFRWEDIVRGEVTLKGKGNKYRRFFFTRQLQSEVKEYIRNTDKTGYVAVGKYGRLTQRNISMAMKNWGRKCDIDKSKMHPHAFRHFFAKMFLKKNKDVIQLAEIMGHGSIDTTRIYLQKSYDEQKRDFNRNVTW